MAQPDSEPHHATNINSQSNSLFHTSRVETLALDQLRWTHRASGHYNPLAPIRQDCGCRDTNPRRGRRAGSTDSRPQVRNTTQTPIARIRWGRNVATNTLVSGEYWSVLQKRFLWQNRQIPYMKNSLPCLTALLATLIAAIALAENEAGGLATEEIDLAVGDRLLVHAVNQLERRESVTARLRHQVALGKSQLYGIGSYWQQGSGEMLRVRLELQIAGQDASMLQVSNSRFLWIDRKLPSGRRVTRVDLRQLRADPVLSASKFEGLPAGQASWSAMQPELVAHSGGLPSLLASLGESFVFQPPQAMRLALSPPLASEPTDIPVFAIVGHWKTEKLWPLLPAKCQEARGKSQEPDSQPPGIQALPERLPQEVLLLVGQEDLFPYRIEYRRLETPLTTDGGGVTIPYQLSANPMVVLEMSDVTFDAPIAAGQFDYAPGDVDWDDQTAQVLERVRREHEERFAERTGASQRELPVR